MKLIKSISELVTTNFVPVEETKEGFLRGGFGEIFSESDPTRVANNCQCNGNDCQCNKGRDNCNCPEMGNVVGNNCSCGTTTTTTTTVAPDGIQFVF